MIEIASDFEFKDKREYVHSSTVCEVIANQICSVLRINPKEVTLEAKFNRFFDRNGIFYCQEQPFSEEFMATAVANFKLRTASGIQYLVLRDAGSKVEHRSDSIYNIDDLRLSNPYSGSARIKVSGYGQFFQNIIELNKRLHLMTSLFSNVQVINVYMKKLLLDIQCIAMEELFVHIENVSVRKHDAGIMTLNKLKIIEKNIEFEMCFFIGKVK
jgi:hypothetical protein